MDVQVGEAVAAFRSGRPVMVFDSDYREKETDLLWPAVSATPEIIRRLRKDCGGLLFLAIGNEVGDLFGLPWLQDIHSNAILVEENPVLQHLVTNDLQYDSKSAFTLSLNHRETFTGITDKDRALTTRRFGKLVGELFESGITGTEAMMALGSEFRTPGHIPVCRESPGGLSSRQGHTELAVSIARLAGVVPCTIGAEMLDPTGDGALSLEDARNYASVNDIPIITGEQISSAFDAKD
ncbi:MAG: 3,4-dihydroxy-2-butanone-4-phosphate synthase [Euryarchaeota archaeon]|nr:3,4-dihydroxy-2-butanone-4-phosphate synthase [Euryarchaeota archaeon]|tara:strand:+ start:2308 stop:3021 length:714 start_codon:yes stop_codon:yes gene_type:complete